MCMLKDCDVSLEMLPGGSDSFSSTQAALVEGCTLSPHICRSLAQEVIKLIRLPLL